MMHQNIRNGVFAALVTAFVFSFLYALAKVLSGKFDIVQVVFFRYLFGIFPPLLYVSKKRKIADFIISKDMLKQQVVRGTSGMIAAVLLFQAFTMMPVGDAVALTFSNSLFLCMLAMPMLAEKVDFARWVAVVIGFIGVVVMSNPTGDVFNYGTILVLACSLIDAYVLLKGKFFSRTMHIGVVVIYYNCFAALSSLLLLPLFWKTPSLYEFGCLALVGLMGGVGQLFLTYAYKSAPGSLIAPIAYTNMIWTLILGYMIWGDLPSMSMMIGGGIVIGAGIYLITHANRKKHEVLMAGELKMPKKDTEDKKSA